MRYEVILAAKPMIGNREDIIALPYIPQTEQVVYLDTAQGLGQEIWYGYLHLREIQEAERQAGKGRDENDPYLVRIPESGDDADEPKKFAEAVNIMCRFIAGDERDNCNVVRRVRPLGKGADVKLASNPLFLLPQDTGRELSKLT